MTNREQVRAIRQAWRQLMPEEPRITYGSGPEINLDLYAQVAVNVLADWGKDQCPRCTPHTAHDGLACAEPITETIRDDVGYGGIKPTGMTRTMIVDFCHCETR